MSLKDYVKLVPQSDKARNKLAWYMNNNPYARIENKREDGRIFLSSQSQPDFWLWVDPPDDPDWRILDYEGKKDQTS